MGRLDNKVVVVNGVGRGIGWAVAETLAVHGATVVATRRSEPEDPFTHPQIIGPHWPRHRGCPTPIGARHACAGR